MAEQWGAAGIGLVWGWLLGLSARATWSRPLRTLLAWCVTVGLLAGVVYLPSGAAGVAWFAAAVTAAGLTSVLWHRRGTRPLPETGTEGRR
jgi:hypothetical protein